MANMAKGNGTYSGFKQVEAAFGHGDDPMMNAIETTDNDQVGTKSNNDDDEEEEEDVFFDASQFDKKGAKTSKVNNNLCSASPSKLHTDVEVNIRFRERPTALKTFINNNQTLLVYSFVVLLFASFFALTIILLKSTAFSIFSLMTIIFYPALIIVCSILQKFSYL